MLRGCTCEKKFEIQFHLGVYLCSTCGGADDWTMNEANEYIQVGLEKQQEAMVKTDGMPILPTRNVKIHESLMIAAKKIREMTTPQDDAMDLAFAKQRVRDMKDAIAEDKSYVADIQDGAALSMLLTVAERGMIPSTADGSIRSLLIDNASKGKFGDIQIDEKKSTLHILVHVLEHLLKPPMVMTYRAAEQSPETVEAIKRCMESMSNKPNIRIVPNAIADHVEKCGRQRAGMVEGLAKEFLETTGLTPDRVELVEQRHNDGKTTWYFQEKIRPHKCLECGAADGDVHKDDCAHMAHHRAAMNMPAKGPSPIAGSFKAFAVGQAMNDAHLARQLGVSIEEVQLSREYGIPLVQEAPKCPKCQNWCGNLDSIYAFHCGACGHKEEKLAVVELAEDCKSGDILFPGERGMLWKSMDCKGGIVAAQCDAKRGDLIDVRTGLKYSRDLFEDCCPMPSKMTVTIQDVSEETKKFCQEFHRVSDAIDECSCKTLLGAADPDCPLHGMEKS